MKKHIIDFIKRNRVSTAEISDCMDKSGLLCQTQSINKGHFVVGNLKYIYACNESNWDVHKQLESIKDNDIAFIDVIDKSNKAIFGDLVSKYLILYKQVQAIVTNGFLRDAHTLLKENWAIWCQGFTPIGYSNQKTIISKKKLNIIKQHKKLYDNSIIVCDDSGVVFIPKKLHTKKFLQKLKNIELQEDIWFDCIDRLKYSTFETVCLQKYKKGKK